MSFVLGSIVYSCNNWAYNDVGGIPGLSNNAIYDIG